MDAAVQLATAHSLDAVSMGRVAVAILGTVGAAVYHHMMVDVTVPGATQDVVGAARSTLGGAFEVAAHLPGDLGRTLLGLARDAFTVGMNYAALTGVGVSFLFALVVFFVEKARSSVAGHGRR